ncbi:MAG UNVERIFIED_CONTAM: hypothetical protein LVR18_15440 [Planctomycetaceae bacterium]
MQTPQSAQQTGGTDQQPVAPCFPPSHHKWEYQQQKSDDRIHSQQQPGAIQQFLQDLPRQRVLAAEAKGCFPRSAMHVRVSMCLWQ